MRRAARCGAQSASNEFEERAGPADVEDRAQRKRAGRVRNPRSGSIQLVSILALARRLDGVVLDPRDEGVVDRARTARRRSAPDRACIRAPGSGCACRSPMRRRRRCGRASPRHAAAHSSGSSDSARMRVRASSPRLVSWVAVAVRPCGLSAGAPAMRCVKLGDRQSRQRGIAADFVERQQRVVAIERGVLQRLRHHRSGELLHLQRELAHPRTRCRAGRRRSDRASTRRAGNRKCRGRGLPSAAVRAAIVRSIKRAVVVATQPAAVT